MKHEDPPAGSEAAHEKGLRKARSQRKHGRSYVFDDFWRMGSFSFRERDKVVQVIEEGGDRRMVTPPADIVHMHTSRKDGRDITFVFYEHPDVRRISLEKLAKRLGYGAKKRLSKSNGLVRDREFAEKLLGSWSK